MNGVSLENNSNNITKLPKKELFIIMVIFISEISSLIYISPFLTFMIQGFGIKEKDVGYYAGGIISSFMIGQFISNFIWGKISEKIGIKPVILIGLFSTSVCTILFGFSNNIYMPFIIRFLGGLFTGNLGVTKTYLYLITDKTNEAIGFAMLPVGMCIGATAAPAIGGLLANPRELWPNQIDDSHIFSKYPYLLASIVISIIPIFGFLVGYIFINEPYKNNDINSINIIENDTNNKIYNKNIIITILIYFNMRMSSLGSESIIPLLQATSKKNKGLELTSKNIGVNLMISAIFLAIFSIMVIPKLKNRYGTLKLFKCAQLLSPFTNVSISILSDLRYLLNPIELSVVTIILIIIRGSVITITVILINLLINNSTEKKYIGRINGISQSFAALGSTIGPALSGILFAWSISNNINFPFDVHFSFIIFSLFSCINIIIINYVDNSITNRIE